MTVIVVGPPGAGVGEVARALGLRLGLPVVDTDTLVETALGAPLAEAFVTGGESAFREAENRALATALDGAAPTVVAVGSGAVDDAGNRERVLAARRAGATVVFVDVGLADAVRRLALTGSVPGIDGPRAAWQRMMTQRRSVYESLATISVSSAGADLDHPDGAARLAEEVAEMIPQTRITQTPTPQTSITQNPADARIRVGADDGYDVLIGRDLLDGAVAGEALTGALAGARQVLLLHAAAVAPVADRLAELLTAAALTVHRVELPDAEAAKTVDVAARCWALLGRAAFTRTDAVVAVGGGAVTDAAGFVAACWLRGVRVVHVPTTLLGMVDAAVGGKTGINTAEGKNLVGAFHPPAEVLGDLATLRTLPRADLVAGLAEVVKAGFIADPVILDLVERNDLDDVLDPDGEVLAELVARAVTVKADVVTQDLRESSLREILNYGHTFAHAVEQVEGYRWRHGDAVAVGMVYAAELGALAGRTPPELVARHRAVLERLGLPTSYRAGRWEDLAAAMGRDKKTRGATLRFVVLDDLARPGRLVAPEEEWLLAAYDRVSG